MSRVEFLRRTKREHELKEFAELNAPLIQAQLRLVPRLTDNQARDRVKDAMEAGDDRLQALWDEVASFGRDGWAWISPAERGPGEEEPVPDPKPQSSAPDDGFTP